MTPRASAISCLGHAAEVPHLDDLSHARVERGHLVERLVNAKNLLLARQSRPTDLRRQADVPQSPAAPRCLAATSEIDDDRAHDAPGPSHEVDPVLQSQSSRAGKPEIRFVHERRRIEEGVAAATPQPHAGQPSQLCVRGRKQAIGRLGIAPLGAMDQLCQADAIVHGEQQRRRGYGVGGGKRLREVWRN